MIKLCVMTATAVLSFAAIPASAREARPADAATPSESNARPGVDPSRVKYCVRDATTGTRISRKICRTRAEWLDQGFDPLAPQ